MSGKCYKFAAMLMTTQKFCDLHHSELSMFVDIKLG